LSRSISTPRSSPAEVLAGLARGQWPSDPLQLPVILTESQVAYLLDKSRSTVRRYRRQGRIPFRLMGRDVLFDRDEILKLARAV
jgi:excisionase family DNA binding protein